MFGKRTTTISGGNIHNDKYADEKGRLYFYDNAKFILIFLVIAAHAITPFMSNGEGQFFFLFIWRIINILHMPCLLFISGFFAKRYIRPDGSFNVQRPFTYMVYYCVAQVVFSLYEIYVLKNTITKSLLEPRASLWFLACLCWWYLLLPVIDKIEPKKMMIIAVLAGLLIGYDAKVSNFMAISRMITHFPFFLFGYYISGDRMKELFSKKAKLWSIPIGVLSLGSVVASMYLFEKTNILKFNINGIITCANSYFKVFNNKGINPALWFLPRVWFYLCAAGLIFCFLVWVPRRKNIFTKFGARTLAPYILHGPLFFAYNTGTGFGWASFDWFKYEWFGWKDIAVLRLCVIPVAFIFAIIFSLSPFYKPFELLGKIKVAKLLRKNEKSK